MQYVFQLILFFYASFSLVEKKLLNGASFKSMVRSLIVSRKVLVERLSLYFSRRYLDPPSVLRAALNSRRLYLTFNLPFQPFFFFVLYFSM